MYLRLFLFVLIVILNTGNLLSQINGSIHIITDSSTISSTFKSEDEFKQAINKKLAALQNNGYLNAALDTLLSEKDTIFAAIYKGNQIVWKELRIIPNNSNIKIPKFRLKVGKAVDLSKITSFKKKLLNAYENNGYPFATINPKTTIVENTLTLQLTIEKGNQYKFDSLIYNKFKISKRFLSGYLNISPGENYSDEIIQRIPQKIEQLTFLQLKSNPTVTFGQGLARPEINITQKKSNYFNGLLGIVPDPDREKKYLITGDIDLVLNNSVGRGEHLKLNWKKNDKYSQELDANIQWPYIFRLPFGFEGKINMLKQDTSFVDVETRTGLFIYFNGSNTATGYYKNSQTVVLNPKDSININRSNTYGSGLKITLKQQDNYLNPSKGYKFDIDISGGKRNTYDSLNQDIKASYIDGNVTLDGFIPLFRNWVINLKYTYGGIYSDKKLYFNEYIRLGGLKTFRGFDENEFISTSYNTSTIELRWLFENLSHFKLFTDIGAFKTKRDDNTLINKVFGIGTGLNLHTNAGIFSISYALGRYHNTRFRFDNAKIHFGYINSF
jgi:hypothetical protein